MLPSPTIPESGIIFPDELTDLKGLFDDACRMNKIPPDTEAAKMTAKRLMSAYLHGVRDRVLLRRLASS